ncbi:MAG: YybH family protein [Thermochromatium sp.]
MRFATPQDVEDAYYDALEAGDAEAMAAVWDDSEAIFCLLPMTPLAVGEQVRRLWQALLTRGRGFDLQVRHLLWIEEGDLAVHLVEEQPQIRADQPRSGAPLPPLYATHVFRRTTDGWRLLVHQNSPTPPPAPSVPSAGHTALA